MAKERVKVLVPDHVSDLIRSMHPHIKRKVRAAFQAITQDPFAGKALKEELAGIRSLRVGKHRIIYGVSMKDRIEFVAVGPRESIYEETYRLLKSGYDTE